MNKEEYKQLLKDKRWNTLRLRILKRDNYTCRNCFKNNRVLHVHHKYYIEGKKPWEYPDSCFLSLCIKCHKEEHEGKTTKDFVKEPVKKEKKPAPKKKEEKKKVKKTKPKPKKPTKKQIAHQERERQVEERRNKRREKSPVYRLEEYKYLKK